MGALLWSSVWAAVWACLCATLETKAGAVGTGRSSDPNVQHGDGGQIFAEPSNLPELPMGKPDTVSSRVAYSTSAV